uniref:aldehyde ferredoxin oxidoreductase N-terminal domain-containing protein n=1 Tax=Vulcanisaeta sp. JCM 14467 TaxID=1295370 RepID=UPI0031839ADD
MRHRRCEKPVYILIDNGDIHIESATDLWGKTTRETEDELRRRYKVPRLSVLDRLARDFS